MAKGNNGNYLQHCIEIEVAKRLVKHDTEGERRLHIAPTHGMAPFEPFENPDKPTNNAHRLLYSGNEVFKNELSQHRRIVEGNYRGR